MADKVSPRPRAARLRQALSGFATPLLGSIAWSLAMGASAALSGALKAKAFGGNLEMTVMVFAFGGLAGFAPGLAAFRYLAAGKSRSQRFSLAFLSLAGATLLFTAITFALIFRSYYAQWHETVFSGDWFRQQFFTTASSFYQFAVLGLRSYLPIGLPSLFLASWLISKKPV